MKITLINILLLLFFLFLLNSCGNNSNEPAEKFYWFIGEWSMQDSNMVTIEKWQPVADGSVEGIGFVLQGKDTVFSEKLLLIKSDNDFFYKAWVGGAQKPVPFRLVDSKDKLAVFENPGHDFPSRIIYDGSYSGELRASLEGLDADGNIIRRFFKYTRAN